MLNREKISLPHRIYGYLLIILLSLIGIAIVGYSTVWGAALSDDSYYYISSARNLLASRGFDLVPNFPPLLPLLLSLIGLFKVDPLISIRWVNALLFGLNIYLIARIVYTLTESYMFSLLGAFIALISSTLIMVHSWAMSEALYICLTLAGIWIYTLGHEKSSWNIPLFTGLCFGLAAATRYIGLSLLFAGGIFWLVEAGKTNQIRIRNAMIFSVAGVIPLLLWIIRNKIVAGQLTNRVFGWHLIPESMWINLLNTVLLWFIPGRFVHGKELIWLGGVIIVLVFWLLVNIFRNRRRGISPSKSEVQRDPIHLIYLCILAYLATLIISRSFLDQRIPMDERLLSPLFAMGLILLMGFFARLWNRNKWLGSGFVIGLCLVIVITNLTRSAQMVQSYHELGRGYASARDHISETYAYLRNRPDIPIYSNAFAGIYFWTGRVTNPLPSPGEIPAMKIAMHQSGAYLVIFNSIPVELYGTTRDELTQGLVEQIRLSEATIYRSP